MIPRLIHQIYLDGSLPAVLQQNVDQIIRLNPRWVHRLYDATAAETLVAEAGEEIARAYHMIDPRYGAARADLLRHVILYQFGGVYCDIKSGFSQPLDETIRPEDSYILCQWANKRGEQFEGIGLHRDLAHVPGGEFVVYFIICERHHPFTAAAIRQIVGNVLNYRPWHSVGRNGVLRTTGPIAYTLAVHPLLNDHPHRLVSADEIGAYPSMMDGYDHFDVFKRHYSTLDVPVVRLGRTGARLSKMCSSLRRLKARLW